MPQNLSKDQITDILLFPIYGKAGWLLFQCLRLPNTIIWKPELSSGNPLFWIHTKMMYNPCSLQHKRGYLKLNLLSLFGNKRWLILWYPSKLLSYQNLPASSRQEMHSGTLCYYSNWQVFKRIHDAAYGEDRDLAPLNLGANTGQNNLCVMQCFN